MTTSNADDNMKGASPKDNQHNCEMTLNLNIGSSPSLFGAIKEKDFIFFFASTILSFEEFHFNTIYQFSGIKKVLF